MTECRTTDRQTAIQDLLPDFVAETLDASVMRDIEQHLVRCDECTADVALLRAAHALRVRTPVMDIGRIVAALPKPPAAVRTMDIRPRRSFIGNNIWRMAAAITVMAVGGTSLIVSRRTPESITAFTNADSARLITDTMAPSTAMVTIASTDTPDVTRAGRASAERRVAVSYGDLGDYTDAELQQVLDRLERWDGTSSTEPLPVVSPVTLTGGGAP